MEPVSYKADSLRWAGASFLKRYNGRATGKRCRLLLWEAQDGKCICCGGPLLSRLRFPRSGDRDTIDHVWPRQAYGFDGPGNVALMRWKCNNRKGGRLPTPELLRKLDDVNSRLGWPTKLREWDTLEDVVAGLDRPARFAP